MIIKRVSNDQIIDLVSNQKDTKGFCIRCHEKIPFNVNRPYCYNCFRVWVIYENVDYEEKYCHECGVKYSTTMIYPCCDDCYFC